MIGDFSGWWKEQSYPRSFDELESMLMFINALSRNEETTKISMISHLIGFSSVGEIPIWLPIKHGEFLI